MNTPGPNGSAALPGTNPVEQVLYEVKKTIVGQDLLLERLIVALLARGHILVEGVPGLAKTLAVKSLAEAVGGDFHGVQFTPDLVPADIVGTRVYHQPSGEFQVSLGPVFTNLLLADEINRAPAKVQSALLEVMQEQQVTIGRETHLVPRPWITLILGPRALTCIRGRDYVLPHDVPELALGGLLHRLVLAYAAISAH